MTDTAYLVYNADGGWIGEATYFVRKWLGMGRCDLCVVTHRGVRRRPEWLAALDTLDVRVEALHRNELDETLLHFIDGQYPCVVGRRDGTLGWISRPDEIEPFVGAPDRLAETIARYFANADET